MLASKPLSEALCDAGIERRGMFDAAQLTKHLPCGQIQPFPSVSINANDASDHAAVWAEFST